MKTLKLMNKYQTNATLVSNAFIDHYMNNANGEFVKVYLLLLRHLNDPASTLTVSMIADRLDNTERDVLRAFRYWEGEGLLTLEKDADGRISGIALEQVCAGDCSAAASPAVSAPAAASAMASAPASTPKAASPAASAAVSAPAGRTIPLDSFKAQKELKSLLFIAEQYLGKTLSRTDVDAITFFYEDLAMPADLIEYLIESCVENSHRSMHYIQKVAIAWHDAGIRTIEEARLRSRSYNKNCYTVLHAFGIKNRAPADAEIAYIKRWTEEYELDLEIVQEACSRTITATHQPSFEYADTILQKWRKSGVRTLSDIAALDDAFQKERAAKKAAAAASRSRAATKNLNNFERRNYDMDSLEERLLNSN